MRNGAWISLYLLAAAGCNDDLDERGLSAGSGEFAVLSNNYMGATSISLLSDTGAVSDDDWVSSKSQNPKLRTPLSEDVVLPTTSRDARVLTTIERGLGVITRFDVEDGDVLGQLRTDDSPEDDKAAYHSNPQDVLYVSETSAWVSRWEPNAAADAEDRERGNDLIEWNPETFERTGRRIDLSELNQEIEEVQFDKDGNPGDSVQATAYASPASLVKVGKYAAVGITGISKSYNYATGKLAIVDLDKAELVSTLELSDLSNCGEVKPVAGDPNSVIVACIGAYGDGGEQAGLLKVRVDDAGRAEIERELRIVDHDDAANTGSNVASLGGDIVVAVAAGVIDAATMKVAEPDRLYRIDLKTGEQTELWESAGAFAIGVPAFAEKTGLLIVPDAGDKPEPVTGVHRFSVNDAREVEHEALVEVAKDTGLAARQVLAL
jgi:hypothetical protein